MDRPGALLLQSCCITTLPSVSASAHFVRVYYHPLYYTSNYWHIKLHGFVLLSLLSLYYHEKKNQEPWVWLIWHAVYELREFINASVLQNKARISCISSLTRVVSHGPLHYNIINTHKNERNYMTQASSSIREVISAVAC